MQLPHIIGDFAATQADVRTNLDGITINLQAKMPVSIAAQSLV